MSNRSRVFIGAYLLAMLVILALGQRFLETSNQGRDISETHWGLNLLYYTRLLERVSRSDIYAFEQQVLQDRAETLTAAPILSHGSGIYPDGLTVEVRLPPGAAGHYSLDGSVPTRRHERVSGPVRITRSAVLRVVGFVGGQPSETVSASYIVTALPGAVAASLVMDPVYLFDRHSGIYSNPTQRGRAWERPATLWIMDAATGVLEADVRIRIHGGASRGSANEGRKSFRVILANDGQQLRDWASTPTIRISDDQIELLLRHAGNEQQFLSDRYIVRIAQQLGLPASTTRPVVLYLNGNLWGVYDLMERMNEKFMLGKTPGQDFLLVHGGPLNDPPSEDSKNSEWNQLYRYIIDNDLADPAIYAFVESQIDIPILVDYFALSIFMADPERPQWNIDLYRTKASTDGPAGRWKFAIWDFDGGLNYRGLFTEHDTLAWHLRSSLRHDLKIAGQPNDTELYVSATRLLRSLMANPDFRTVFRERFDILLRTTFSVENLEATLRELLRDYAPVMELEKQRFDEQGHWLLDEIVRLEPPRIPVSYEDRMSDIRDFIAHRTNVLGGLLTEYFAQYHEQE